MRRGDSLLSVKIELNGIPNPIPFRTSWREPEIFIHF